MVEAASSASKAISDPVLPAVSTVTAQKSTDTTFTFLGQADATNSMNTIDSDDETDYDSFLTKKGASSRYNYSLKASPGRGWSVNFEALLAFGAQYGHYNVPITVQGNFMLSYNLNLFEHIFHKFVETKSHFLYM